MSEPEPLPEPLPDEAQRVVWVSQHEVLAARSARGGWTKKTLSSWGVGWPPPAGWQRQLTGTGRPADAGTSPDPARLRPAATPTTGLTTHPVAIPAEAATAAPGVPAPSATTAGASATAPTPGTHCPVPTRKGQPCPFDAGPRGLCHVHDPDAAYALQHPATRAALLQRPEVQAVLDRTAAHRDHTEHEGAPDADHGNDSSRSAPPPLPDEDSLQEARAAALAALRRLDEDTLW